MNALALRHEQDAFVVIDEAPGVGATPARIDAWLAVARAGDRFVYASRAFLPRGHGGAAKMRLLAERGIVSLIRPRSTVDPTVFNYTAKRTTAPLVVETPPRPRLKMSAPVLVDAEAAIVDALLPVVERFAKAGRPCPTDKQLADRARLTEVEVKVGLAAMVAAHLIRVQGCAAPTYRRIVVVASGAITGIAA